MHQRMQRKSNEPMQKAEITHNPKVVSSSLTPATKEIIRVAIDCGLLFF